MPSLWGLHLLQLLLFDTFILAFNNVSLSCCVCVLMHLRIDFMFCLYVCMSVWMCVFWGREVVIMLKWLEPSCGAVCLITVEQSPLICHCSPICLLQMSNLCTEPSIIFMFHINTAAMKTVSHSRTPRTNLSKCMLVRTVCMLSYN